MSTRRHRRLNWTLSALLAACGGADSESDPFPVGAHAEQGAEVAKGPHGGRLLTDDDFTLELAIFESGVPPVLRAWITENDQPVDPTAVQLSIQLTRLGNRVDEIGFSPRGDFLQGDTVVYEPHSFVVSIEAVHDGRKHTWQYDNFEGRTRISAEVAESFGVETMIVGPVVLEEMVTVYGRIRSNPGRVREIRARFEGVLQTVVAEIGDAVHQGQKLLTVESNESLKSYAVTAPIDGIITQRAANPGEQTSSRLLMTITDTSSVWADLSIFPGDRSRVRVGAPVTITAATGGLPAHGIISTIDVLATSTQAVIARVVLENAGGHLLPGTYVIARVTVGEHSVPLAVMRTGIQDFRDFKVVYAQIGEEYEVRMLELGRQAGKYVEVLGGLEPGTRYVSKNSYLIKADIEKSGASHDH